MIFYTEEAALWKRHKESMIQKINDSNLPLVIFGRVVGANPAFLSSVKVPVEYVVSNHPTSWGKRMWGLEVIGPDRMEKAYSAYNVLILCVHYSEEITKQLQNLSSPPAEIFQLDLRFEQDDVAGYFKKMQSTIENVYERFADQKSKDTYEALIRYRINRNPEYLHPIFCPEEEYFPEMLDGIPFLTSNEIFVDVGAYIGDTVKRFIAAVNRQYHTIYAFEPDPLNYQKLIHETTEFPNIICRQLSTLDRCDKIHFCSNGQTSQLKESGNVLVQSNTLDHQFENEPVTFIKMDIEGAECLALRGARCLIQKYQPKLAICTYHSMEDMVMVPDLIVKLNPNYKLYLRHYCDNAIEQTICYAI